MNIVFSIGAYMLASSLIMVGYVWFRSFKHSQLDYEQMSETDSYTGEVHTAGENIAA